MLELTPTTNYFIILAGAALVALLITFFMIRKVKITNPSFAFIRAMATFTALWLIWGNIARQTIDATKYQEIGFFKYLTLQYMPTTGQNWIISAQLELVALIFSLIATLVASLGLSLILSRLAAVSDRHH